MKTLKRRTLSFLMAIVMMLSLQPVAQISANAACGVNHATPSAAPGSNFMTTKVGSRYTAVCKTCGAEFQLGNLNTMDAGVYSMNKSDASLCTTPYRESGYLCPLKGTEYNVIGSVINAYGNKWYKTSNGEWLYSGDVKLVRSLTSTLEFSGVNVPSSLKKGESFSLQGKVTSNYAITSLRGQIVSESGSVQSTMTVYPNSHSYNIANSSLSAHMLFNSLAVGSYYITYTASDASGNSISWRSNTFFVKEDAPFDKNGIAVSGLKKVGTLTKGDRAAPAGTVKSNAPISWIWVGVTSLNEGSYNTHIYEKQDWPVADSFDISTLASQIPFENLPVGTYRFGVEGNRATSTYFVAVSETFEVKAKEEKKEETPHVHKLELVSGYVATCTAAGRSDYWMCRGCGNYFADSSGNKQIKLADATIAALGHNYSNGVCTRCGERTNEPAKTYTVTFNANGGSVSI